jgi:hypothetical protein
MLLRSMSTAIPTISTDPARRVARPGAYPPDNFKRRFANLMAARSQSQA